METAALIYEGLSTYFWIGLGVATLLLVIAIDRIDPNAHGAFIFRVLLIPGIIVLWPLVLLRWAVLELKGSGEERQYAHRAVDVRVWFLLPILLPFALLGAVVLRSQGPLEKTGRTAGSTL